MTRNVHGTAIVVGERGLIFIGPSGVGKSMMAFTCLAIARRAKAFSALISDDQVFLTQQQERIVATCPPSISGLMELRGSGIVRMDHVGSAPLDLAIQLVPVSEAERLPPENESWQIGDIGSLPLVKMANNVADPLAVIGGLLPAWRQETPFW
ncbi:MULTISPECIES: HPr kinase/phosphorylase [Rhizobiaceae]|jgi:serine kinase of HPr protein (carbohydrate metabolism regulator)|uniref:Serine kinase of HPr protein (Carbohydrate metabolism regulator) n=1 Tax=Aliirhizobium cellulosilyticum TaxID=393664 RepID=A0A7W6XE22_9HYPH|nr:HPr kinase/phosphatase C-terminal domain-containing protein [Rhizobium cellulosilyticum]MBB4351431.1 serine kinase of HPr protein (carbohydrate metabolism regulator) [Rhizobium cellulosilyticum]MBB4414624.1 serine kinase of HPr protein (carbohydrate metabolism regulator) [Rhizobium cellulosilyticum]MBB4449240.1 serine kinase of HPr protein (carbohydrate metabolism regulator) [Rhizobium cellulosilyticum]